MIYRDFGQTKKKVSIIGFGGVRFLRKDYENDNFEKCAQLIVRARDLGINYFDTAPNYCDGKSELIMGTAFKNMKKDFYVSTKVALWNATTAEDTRKLIETSLKNLNLEKITFYNMWCIKTIDEYEAFIKKGGPYEGALKAKEEGLIEHICFSTHMNGKDIETVVNQGMFEGVTLGYNAMNFAYRRQGVAASYKKGIGVAIMNPLGGGVIPNNPNYFSFLKKNNNDSISIAALKFVLSQKEISLALAGIENMEQLEENVLAADNISMINEQELQETAKYLSEELNSLCTSCGYCNYCPVKIEIPKLMDAYNDYIFSNGNVRAVLNKLTIQWNIRATTSRNCIKCGKCEKLCTQKLPIIERLSEIAKM